MILNEYNNAVARGQILHNNHQVFVINILDKILVDLSGFRLFKPIPRGLYLYGNVGSGKSMVIDMFYKNCSLPIKRVHFHKFMSDIHDLIKMKRDLAVGEKLIREVVNDYLPTEKILILDEFQVEDVADALILRRLFECIFEKKIILLTSSNKKPEDLYQNGLQRDMFLQFVALLREKCQIIDIEHNIDYRKRGKLRKNYFHPFHQRDFDSVLKRFSCDIDMFHEEFIESSKRQIRIAKSCNDVAIFTFDELFRQAFSARDYHKICEKFEVMILIDVPNLTKDDDDAVKRFVLFIDQAYEFRRVIVFFAEDKIENLYSGHNLSFIFQRTVSRINEITSEIYEI